MWAEAINMEYQLCDDQSWSNVIPITAAIDCKPVFDHANSSVVAIKDKRMAIEMLLLKQDIQKHNISLRWMATQQMVVDVLTKIGAPLNLFRRVMGEGAFVLVEDKEVVAWSQKRKKSSKETFQSMSFSGCEKHNKCFQHPVDTA
jgi:hypothetical protein